MSVAARVAREMGVKLGNEVSSSGIQERETSDLGPGRSVLLTTSPSLGTGWSSLPPRRL